jgi:hypothetical protein
MFPPHLPPPTCNIARYRQRQRLQYIIAASFFGVCGGIAGAAIMLGWIWPGFNDSVSWLVTRNSFTLSRSDMQNRAEAKMVDKIFSVYKKTQTQNSVHYFNTSDKLGDAVMGVNAGWLVMGLPVLDSNKKDWVVVANDGTLFRLGTILTDKWAQLLYAELVPYSSSTNHIQQQFKVATFNTDVAQFDNLFIFQDGQWLAAVNLGRVAPPTGESHLDSLPPFVFNINDNYKNNSIVIDSQGNVVGLVANRSTVVPFVSATYFLNGIARRKQIMYPTLGVQGWYGEEKLFIVNEEKVLGFIVDKVVGNKALFQRGDILLTANGRPLNWSTLWYTDSGQVVRIQLYRAGKTMDVSVPMIQIPS